MIAVIGQLIVVIFLMFLQMAIYSYYSRYSGLMKKEHKENGIELFYNTPEEEFISRWPSSIVERSKNEKTNSIIYKHNLLVRIYWTTLIVAIVLFLLYLIFS